jgi:hypothetical protein
MTRKAKWTLIAFLILLAYGLAVFLFWDNLPRPYERPSKPSKAEEKAMEKARKRHGNYTQIITNAGIYMERIGKDGKPERVWILKRRERS